MQYQQITNAPVTELHPRQSRLGRRNAGFAAAIHSPSIADKQRVSTSETERRSFPLSFAQQRLWVLDCLEPGNGVYNLGFAVLADGALDVDALQSALDEIAGCHEILRAEFHVEGDAPRLGGEAGVGAFVNAVRQEFTMCVRPNVVMPSP
jgi:hypothetical protein